MLHSMLNRLRDRRCLVAVSCLALLAVVAALGIRTFTRPNTPQLLRRAASLTDQGEFESAVALYDEILKYHPSHPQALQARGRLAHQAGDLSSAEAFCRQVPDDTSTLGGQARYLQGSILLEMGRAREAEAAFQKACTLAPHSIDPHMGLLKLYAVQLRPAETRRELLAIHRLRSWTLPELYQFVNYSGEAVHRIEALPLLKRWTLADPDDQNNIVALARFLLWDDRPTEALATLQGALVRDPNNDKFQALAAEVLLHIGDTRGAIEKLRHLTFNSSSPPGVWKCLGQCLAEERQWPEAAAVLSRAVTMRPWDRTAAIQLARALEHCDRKAESQQFYRRAQLLVELKAAMFRFVQAPANRSQTALQALLETGHLLRQLERFEESAAFFEHILNVNPNWPDAQSAYAEAVRLAELAADQPHEPEDKTELQAAVIAARALYALAGRTGTTAAVAARNAKIRFVDRRADAGIEYQFLNGASGRKHLLETTGGGVAVFDFDADGWPDLFFPQGGSILADSPASQPSDSLFHNQHDGTFRDVSVPSGLDDRQFSQGCAAGDYDNDGFPDLAIGNCGTNALFHNNGDGTFTNVTRDSGIRGQHWTTSLGWGDLDRDGTLDLYVVNYVVEHLRPCLHPSGAAVLCHPQVYEAEPDALYLSRGDGTFSESLRDSGMSAPDGRGLGVILADLNDDGWTDVYVANDANPSFLFKNLKQTGGMGAQFANVGFASGTAVNAAGNATAAMGIACGDLDSDGLPDLYITNFYNEPDLLYLNRGDMLFDDATASAGLVGPTRSTLGWGTQVLDVDLDGRPEIFVANGHLDDLRARGIPWKMSPQLFYNVGSGSLADVSRECGEYFHGAYLGRGTARLDWNRDGRPDLVVVHHDRPTALLTNETEPFGQWLALELRGVESNRDAVGARVRVVAGDHTQFLFVCGGDGYCATNERRQFIGLGAADTVSVLEVRWPNGRVQKWNNVPSCRSLILIEGRESWVSIR
ncbi:MAG: VCBS repeat-containing protein [Planctomycetes bacterium]|nr:VCBS repeat-containing protein [Planctomycetota bacterium]